MTKMTSLLTRTFSLSDIAKSRALVTRDQGAFLRNEILKILQSEKSITLVLDFKEIESLSPSFADELFASLDASLGNQFSTRIKISGASNDWKDLIRKVLAHRRILQARASS